MHYLIEQIEVSIFTSDLRPAAAAALHIAPQQVQAVQVLRRSLDARRHRDPRFVYRLAVTVTADCRVRTGAGIEAYAAPAPAIMPRQPVADAAPIIVGAGPAGLFAALAFAESGNPAIVIERGDPVRQRIHCVNRFRRAGILDPESNVYFGEGGAGTFSDGKLNSRSRHPWMQRILQELVDVGAPAQILYDTRAHVGTDVLLRLLPRLRQRLSALGTTFHFRTCLTDLRPRHEGGIEVWLNGQAQLARPLIIAGGHSAFDLYELLLRRGVAMSVKGSAIGCRIEHPAELISRRFFGADPRLPALLGHAPYQLTAKLGNGANSVYSFCCCPGGEVVACSTVAGALSVNGMSFSHRSAAFTNAALVSGFEPADWAATPQQALQRRLELERHCFAIAGGDYTIPAQRATDFLAGRASRSLPPTSGRRPAVAANLLQLLPKMIASRLQQALPLLERQVPGWIDNGVMLGIETTTSSVVRIDRNDYRESVNTPDLLPVGEGSGYAGGIMTSALDGLLAATVWLERHGRQ